MGSTMKDRSDDPLHHEQTLLPHSYISIATHKCHKNLKKNNIPLFYLPFVSNLLSKKKNQWGIDTAIPTLVLLHLGDKILFIFHGIPVSTLIWDPIFWRFVTRLSITPVRNFNRPGTFFILHNILGTSLNSSLVLYLPWFEATSFECSQGTTCTYLDLRPHLLNVPKEQPVPTLIWGHIFWMFPRNNLYLP